MNIKPEIHVIRLIKIIGGNKRGALTRTAEALKTRQEYVSFWKAGRCCMTPKIAIRAEKITHGKVKRWQLNPNAFEKY